MTSFNNFTPDLDGSKSPEPPSSNAESSCAIPSKVVSNACLTSVVPIRKYGRNIVITAINENTVIRMLKHIFLLFIPFYPSLFILRLYPYRNRRIVVHIRSFSVLVHYLNHAIKPRIYRIRLLQTLHHLFFRDLLPESVRTK